MKPFWKSKTLWFNLLTGLATVSDILPPQWAALAIAISNIGLRLVTTEAIHVLPQ